MTEQLLDDPQIRAALQQMRGERVAQRVRADPPGEVRPRGSALDRRPGLLASPVAPAAELRMSSSRAATIAAIGIRAPQSRTSQCWRTRWTTRSPVDSSESA